MSLQKTPEQISNIGSSRGKTIGSMRPLLIGQLRSAKLSSIFRDGLMLVPNDQSGLLLGRKQQNLGDNLPPTATYDSAPIYREHTFEFRPTGGYGESVQSSRTDRRYHYAINCWVTGGLFGLGPASHKIVPPQTGSVRMFVEALNASSQLRLFVLAGANVLERTDDSNAGQVVSRSRAGHIATDAVRFMGGYGGAVDALYVAWDDGVLVALIFEPRGGPVSDEWFERAEELDVYAVTMLVASLDDVLVTKLLALTEQLLDYSGVLEIARAVREQIDWDDVRRRCEGSPYAAAFFVLVEELGVAPAAAAPR